MTPIPPLEQLDSWIAARESRFTLKPGCAAGVVWAGERVKTPVSIVYLHGYTASRGELYPVPDLVARDLGANLFYARLSGHAEIPDGHASVTLEDWFEDGDRAWAIGQALGERVVLMGCSTGATLAAWLVLGRVRARPAASVLVSPNLGPKNRGTELLLLPGRGWLVKRLAGESIGWEPENEAGARYWDYRHASRSLIPMMDLVAATRRLRFQNWPTPGLVVYAPDDRIVEERITVKHFRRSPNIRFDVWHGTLGNHHVLAGDAVAPEGTSQMVALAADFLRSALPTPQ